MIFILIAAALLSSCTSLKTSHETQASGSSKGAARNSSPKATLNIDEYSYQQPFEVPLAGHKLLGESVFLKDKLVFFSEEGLAWFDLSDQKTEAIFKEDLTTGGLSANSLRNEILYVKATVEGGSEIYSLGGAKAERKKITSTPATPKSDPTLSRDAKTIIYSARVNDDFELFSISSTGTNAKRLSARPGADGTAAISPDQKHIAWRGFDARRKDRSDIYVAQLKWQGSTPWLDKIKVISEKFGGLNLTPHWVNNSRLVFSSNRGNEESMNLYLYDIHSACLTRLSDREGVEIFPQVSEDGRFLAWTYVEPGTVHGRLFLAPLFEVKSNCDGIKVASEVGRLKINGVDGR